MKITLDNAPDGVYHHGTNRRLFYHDTGWLRGWNQDMSRFMFAFSKMYHSRRGWVAEKRHFEKENILVVPLVFMTGEK